MSRGRDRECLRCHNVQFTASKSDYCRLCAEANKRDEIIERESQDIISWGYAKLQGPWIDKFNHRCYKVLTPCGHEWSAPYTNILKQIKNAQRKGLRPPCGVCGPKHRMDVALQAYVEKHGRDYDFDVYKDYLIKVRGLSDVNYKKFKRIINPQNFKRGMKAHHLDHKVPIVECFKRGWPPEKASAVENLQMLSWEDNLSKGSQFMS